MCRARVRHGDQFARSARARVKAGQAKIGNAALGASLPNGITTNEFNQDDAIQLKLRRRRQYRLDHSESRARRERRHAGEQAGQPDHFLEA